ncbi:hypothetical protein BKA62DRAFT_754558 [Auriculariales sp. MPI-PUGE-AT-0066]|nr:hypothetical protein BKA62DRAFT_754558 [Auriculariales sp. MPI-PUGE-AT-0066]
MAKQQQVSSQSLADEFKKSGEFDRIRHDVIARFNASPEKERIMNRVREIATQKLAGDPLSAHRSQEDTVKEIMLEVERCSLNDPALVQFTYLNSADLKDALYASLSQTMSNASDTTNAASK